jgi:SAM-dependent methyltransferase
MASKPSERLLWAVDTLALDPADRVLERRNGDHVAAGRAVRRTAALEEVNFEDERYDEVFAFNVAPFWLQPKRALGIVGRQLSPDGTVYLFWDARHTQPGRARDLADQLVDRIRLAEDRERCHHPAPAHVHVHRCSSREAALSTPRCLRRPAVALPDDDHGRRRAEPQTPAVSRTYW